VTTKRSNLIEGVPTYRILSNPTYMQQLHYYSPTEVESVTVHRLRADVAYLCLNYAFLTDDVRNNFIIYKN
jgi:hypothetical protein